MGRGLWAAAACLLAQQPDFPEIVGPYLGQEPPGLTAKLFAPGLVSTGQFEHSSPVFTPDLKEIYWSVIIEEGRTTVARPILFMKRTGEAWSRPAVPSFAKTFACSESPFISPDGRDIYFHASDSLRPEKARLFRAPRAGDGWGGPVDLGDPVNAASLSYGPSVAANGNLYFAAPSGVYAAERAAGGYRAPAFLKKANFGPYIAPDESYIIFCSFREGGFGSGDLYISFRRKDGSWGDDINMGRRINTDRNERFPNVTPDGKYLFFNSTRMIPGAGPGDPGNGNGDVYWIDARIIEELKPPASGR
jgi:Tol biopolymer transport system component